MAIWKYLCRPIPHVLDSPVIIEGTYQPPPARQWLQVRRVGAEQWWNVREVRDEDAETELANQRRTSMPDWEFRLALRHA